MSSQVLLQSLSHEQKLALLEELWEDLTHDSHDIPSPDWHREILEERRVQLENGNAEILDWEDAQRAIREKISES